MLAARRLFLCVLFAACCEVAYSQDTCQQSLNQATAEFEAGRFYSLPSILKECLESGFSFEQSFRAYYLLTQAYLVLDDPLGAEQSYLKLLQLNPEFIPNANTDPIDIVYLSRKFTTRPKFTQYFRVGANYSSPRTIYEMNTFSGNPTIGRTPQIGFHLGLGLDWNLSDKWSVGMEVNYATKSHAETVGSIALHDRLELIDRSIWFDIPLLIKYSDDIGRWRPFVYAGVAANLQLASSGSFSFTNYSPTQGSNIKLTEGPDEEFTYKRNVLNRSVVGGGGVKYKLGKNFLFVDVRYMMGLSNITVPDKNFYQPDGTTLASTVTEYQFSSDYFRLDDLSISLGFFRPIYYPRKIRTNKGNGFLRRIFKSKAR